MKTTLLISLGKETFSNVSIDFDGTADEALAEGKRLLAVMNGGGVGLPIKEYNAFIDRQLMGEPNSIEEYNLMSEEQKQTVQTVKRAIKRIEAKQ